MASTIEVNKLVTTFAFKLNKGEIRSYEQTLKRLDKQGQTMAKNASKAMSQGLGATAKAMNAQFSSVFKRIQSQANNLKLNPKINVDNSSAKAKIKEVDSMVNGLTRSLGSMALGLGGGVGAMGLGRYVGTAAGELETSMARLKTIVGPGFAKGAFGSLQKFAKDTPYELKDVMEMFTSLQGAGFDLMDRKTGKMHYGRLEKLGDLASVSGKGLPELTQAILSSSRGLPSMMDNFIGLRGNKRMVDGEEFIHANMMDPRTKKVLVDKMINEKNKDELFDFWLQAGSRNGITGGMKELSKTLPGQISTLSDTLKNLVQKMWMAGLGEPIHKGINDLMKGLDKLEPKFKSAGKMGGKIVTALQGMSKYAPLAAAGAGLLATRMAGTQLILGAKALWSALSALRGMSMLTLLGGWPMLIGAAAVAIGYLGYEIFKFATTGEGLIKNLSDKFPGFKDAVKLVGDEFNKLKPVLGEIWKNLTEITEQMLKDLGPVAKDMFENWFIPAVTNGLNAFAGFLRDWREGYKSLKIDLENARKAISGFGGDCVYWFENAKNTLNLFREVADGVLNTMGKMYPVFKPIFEMLRKMVGWNNFGAEAQGSGPGGASAMLGGGLNELGAAKLSRAAQNVTAESGYCLWAIKQTLQAVYGDWKGAGAMSVPGYKGKFAPGGHAADFGPQLMQMGFKKIKVKSMDQMPDGGIAIYPRGVAGFSANSGHIEAFDKETNAFYYGRGAHNANSRKNSIQYADVYVPTGAGGRVTNAPNPQNQGLMQNGMLNPSITQNLYFNGNVNPQQTANGAGKGVDKALDFATAKYSYLTGK